MRPWHVALVLTTACTGCTTVALDRETVRQTATMADLRYQEVLNDLAAIANNRWILPSYCSIYAGTTKISDMASTNSVTTIGRELLKIGSITHFQAETLDVMGQRSVTDVWTLDPVSGPEKLNAMRAACWWILDGPNCLPPESRSLLNGPDVDHTPGYHFDVANALGKIQPGWLHVGKLTNVPLKACYKAHCHDTWVWVMPDGTAGLADFTLVMQAIARVLTDAMYFPKPETRTLTITNKAHGDACGTIDIKVYVGPNGKLAAGDKQYTYPVKFREESVISDVTLKSQIAASQTK